MDKFALLDALRDNPFGGSIPGSAVVSICKLVEQGLELDALAQRLAASHFPGDGRAAEAFERALKAAGYE